MAGEDVPGSATAGETRHREVTVSAVVFGLIFGVLMNASITYAGLKIGFTIGGSAIAAILGFGVLRGILRKGTILETNIAQTVASAVNIPSGGIIFTVPVLFLLGYQLRAGDAQFWLVTLACVVGSVLGCAFIIPLRKQMIDIDRLRFPTGTAVAEILKTPGAGVAKSVVLVTGAVIGGIIYLPVALPELNEKFGYAALDYRVAEPAPAQPGDAQDAARYRRAMKEADRDGDGQTDLVMTNESIDVGRALGLPSVLLLAFAISPLSLGAGYVTGRPGLMILAGGVLAFFVINPVGYLWGLMPVTVAQHEVPGYAYQAFNRPLGIGMLLGGALMGILFSLPAMKAALSSISAATHLKVGSDELGFKPLAVAIVLSAVGLFVISLLVSDADRVPDVPTAPAAAEAAHAANVDREATDSQRPAVNGDAGGDQQSASAESRHDRGLLAGLHPVVRSLIIAAVGLVWIWFAGIIIAQCTGMTDWSPISGMALLTVVLVMLLAGTGNELGAVVIGAALCVSVSCAADMMQDLKTGHLVGSVPRRQQIVELAVTGIGPVVSMLVLLLIVEINLKGGLPPLGPGTDTTAPQAQALQSIIQGVQGGDMPYALYAMGTLLGILMGLSGFAGMGVLVGLSMYLPIKYILTYGIGCVINMIVVRVKGQSWSEEWGLPLCAGLIVGEALVSLTVNGIVLLKG